MVQQSHEPATVCSHSKSAVLSAHCTKHHHKGHTAQASTTLTLANSGVSRVSTYVSLWVVVVTMFLVQSIGAQGDYMQDDEDLQLQALPYQTPYDVIPETLSSSLSASSTVNKRDRCYCDLDLFCFGCRRRKRPDLRNLLAAAVFNGDKDKEREEREREKRSARVKNLSLLLKRLRSLRN